ncbi:hypothetical protein L13192_10643 [Pyrenophora tritici-repentis]|nr:hypothetical protein L13192_10643 [Pyrenophora tritici-repentis]
MNEITNWLKLRFPDDLIVDANTPQEYGRLRQRESLAGSDAKIRERLTCVYCGKSNTR